MQYTTPTNGTKYPVCEHTHCNPHDKSSIVEDNDLPVLNPDMPFIGRDKELAEIASYLRSDSVYVIGIHGPPAFGKSTLAIHVGWEMVKTGIPVRYVEVSERNVFGSSQNVETTSTNAGVQSYTGHLQLHTEQSNFWSKRDVCQGTKSFCSDLVQWAGTLASKHVLILDNCDGILSGEEKDKFMRLINDLFKQSTYNHLSIVITSQTRVTFINQRAITYHISELPPTASLALLQAIVTNKHNITKEVGEKVATLVGRCPLALKVVAVTMRDFPGDSILPIVDRLERDVLKAISSRTLSTEDRFEAVMDIAYSYLPTETKKCVSYVCGFPGSFNESAGRNVLNSCGVKGQDCLETLESRSLIEHYWFGTEFRYQMHRLIREYFRFNQSTDFDPNFQEYYLSAFLELYTEGGTAGHDSTYTAHKFTVEFPNLEHLFKILLNLSIYEREAGVLAFGYINEQVTFHEHANFSKKLFRALNTYKQYLWTTLGEVRYNSLYADLLGQLYESECKLQHNYDECRCAEMCKTAFTLWYSQHSCGLKSSELSVYCFDCPLMLTISYFTDSSIHLVVEFVSKFLNDSEFVYLRLQSLFWVCFHQHVHRIIIYDNSPSWTTFICYTVGCPIICSFVIHFTTRTVHITTLSNTNGWCVCPH